MDRMKKYEAMRKTYSNAPYEANEEAMQNEYLARNIRNIQATLDEERNIMPPEHKRILEKKLIELQSKYKGSQKSNRSGNHTFPNWIIERSQATGEPISKIVKDVMDGGKYGAIGEEAVKGAKYGVVGDKITGGDKYWLIGRNGSDTYEAGIPKPPIVKPTEDFIDKHIYPFTGQLGREVSNVGRNSNNLFTNMYNEVKNDPSLLVTLPPIASLPPVMSNHLMKSYADYQNAIKPTGSYYRDYMDDPTYYSD